MNMNFYQIHAFVRDVPFYFRKKAGFPRLKEHGVADIVVGGQGICILLKLGVDPKSKTTTLIRKRVQVFVDEVDATIQGSTRE